MILLFDIVFLEGPPAPLTVDPVRQAPCLTHSYAAKAQHIRSAQHKTQTVTESKMFSYLFL